MMVDRSAHSWSLFAAYLYVLHLDGPALAWEYLRRHPDYRRDWLNRCHRQERARNWGLRFPEDPDLDARDAHPAWFPDHEAVLQLYPDLDPPPNTNSFEFWRIPGRKHLIHDGKRLVLMASGSGYRQRLALAPGLEDGMACVYAVRPGVTRGARRHRLVAQFDALVAPTEAVPAMVTWPRPTATTLLESDTLRALDANLAGASLRETAAGLFGADAAEVDWHTDSSLRSRVRRLVQRGQSLMRGGYRRLAQLD